MFHNSSQMKMLFKSEAEIQSRRSAANDRFKESNPCCSEHFLSVDDERLLCRKFERELIRFCSIFEDPPLYRSVKCTAMNYFKRFYMKHTPMEFYPQHVMFLCVYVACKVEEYNICIDKFVAMLEESLQHESGSFIIAHEFLLMEALEYSLIVHNAYRPLDGFILQLTPKLPQNVMGDLVKQANSFINDAILTDCTHLYAPSQIALAAVTYASERTKSTETVEAFVREICPDTVTHTKLTKVIAEIRRHLQHNYKFQITSSKLRELEQKCRSIRTALASENDTNSSSDENNSNRVSAPVSKRRKTDDEMDG